MTLTTRRPYIGAARKQREAQNREKALAAARRVFAAGGYEHATMRLIAKEAGLSTGALFHNWPGKAELHAEIYGAESAARRLAETAAALAGRDWWALADSQRRPIIEAARVMLPEAA